MVVTARVGLSSLRRGTKRRQHATVALSRVFFAALTFCVLSSLGLLLTVCLCPVLVMFARKRRKWPYFFSFFALLLL